MSDLLYMENGLVQVWGGYYFEARSALLVLFLIAALGCDVRWNRVPNWIVLCGALGAMAYHVFVPSGMGLAYALKGLGVGIAVLLPFYLLRTMGAGDVKLMGMAGAFIGASATINAALLTLIAGGLLAGLVALRNGVFRVAARNVSFILKTAAIRTIAGGRIEIDAAGNSAGKLPYVIAIAAGVFLQIGLARFGYAIL